MSFQIDIPVRFHHCDPAGVLFYGEIFKFHHSTFEAFIINLGIPYSEWFENEEFAVPIVHSESTYKLPMLPGQNYQADLKIVKVGNSSLQVETQYFDSKLPDSPSSSVKTTHVFVDSLGEKVQIPKKYRDLLAS